MKTLPICLLVLVFHAAGAMDVGVRVRFGLTDKAPTKWDGTVTVSPGQVGEISGWRFLATDAVDGTNGWKASTRRVAPQAARTNNPRRANANANANAAAPLNDNGVVINLRAVTEDSRVEIKTAKGDFDFKLSEIPFGKFAEKLAGSVEIERVAFATRVSADRTDDDFPALAVGSDGLTCLAYVSFTPGLDRDERARQWTKAPDDFAFLAKPAGGDVVWLRTKMGDDAWSEPRAVTEGAGGDVYKCAVAVDGKNRVWVFWAENKGGNFDIWARAWSRDGFAPAERISSSVENDICPVAATDGKGQVWVAWQGAREKVFRILERHQNGQGGWSAERRVSGQSRNCWSPSIAGSKRSVAIAWDTYDKGDYDVWLRKFSLDGSAQEALPVANTTRYEARPSVVFDGTGRLWVAWEESGATWGKDWGALVQGKAIPLYADRQIGLRVLDEAGTWLDAGDFTSALPGASRPGARARRRVNAQRVPALEPESETRQQAQEAQTRAGAPYNNISRVVADRDGRIWLLARSRANDFRAPIGSVWMEHASYLDGTNWVGPILFPHSDNLLYNMPAVAADPRGGLIVAHSSDHRQDRHVVGRQAAAGNAALGADRDPFDNDIYLSRLEVAGTVPAATLKNAKNGPAKSVEVSAATQKELADIQRCHDYRITVDGKELRLQRGEFHRHTEISGDGGNDGPLEDMWRYAMDVASMDWIGCGDHDNGNGREYTWWLTQKTTDAFRQRGMFDPLFTYERSVRYPEGHRNVIFTQRGVRTLPRLPKVNEADPGNAPDTQMLYRYLKFFGGICASHTSATDMGTDWRDNDPAVEPFVEIYQGCRQNYERPGAPRSPSEGDAIGGWRPKGFINLALQKGYRLGFESSSDHRSTHISYCIAYAEEGTRESVLKAMKARHTYAATDNIIADVRCAADGKEHMMGDEFSTRQAPTLRVRLVGTEKFARVVIVKNDEEVKVVQPGSARVDFEWTDPSPTSGKASYYYVRGEQVPDAGGGLGELVWASPMWITVGK